MDSFGIFIVGATGFLLGMAFMGVIIIEDFHKEAVGRGYATYDKDGRWEWKESTDNRGE